MMDMSSDEVSLRKFCDNSHDLYLFGAGEYGKQVGMWLYKNEFIFNGYVVTSKQKEKFCGKNVWSVNELKVLREGEKISFLICINEQFHKEITKMLLEKFPNSSLFYIDNKTEENLKRQNAEKIPDYPIRFNGVNIILFHNVANMSIDWLNHAISPITFELIIKYLKDNYNVTHFENLNSDSKDSVVITFDDGYEGVYNNAFPILKKYNIPATVFVSTGFIDTNKDLWTTELLKMIFYNKSCPSKINFLGEELYLGSNYDKRKSLFRIRENLINQPSKEREYSIDKLRGVFRYDEDLCIEKIMTSKEILEMDKSNIIEIGAHTVTHCNLSVESTNDQYKEIYMSKKRLEDLLNHDIVSFAYPFGGINSYSISTYDNLRRVGIRKCATTIPGMNYKTTNPMFLKRNSVPCGQDMTLSKFKKWFNETLFL